MIVRKESDGWLTFLADDHETVLFQCKPPREGFTADELEQFIEHLKREVARKEVGPS